MPVSEEKRIRTLEALKGTFPGFDGSKATLRLWDLAFNKMTEAGVDVALEYCATDYTGDFCPRPGQFKKFSMGHGAKFGGSLDDKKWVPWRDDQGRDIAWHPDMELEGVELVEPVQAYFRRMELTEEQKQLTAEIRAYVDRLKNKIARQEAKEPQPREEF